MRKIEPGHGFWIDSELSYRENGHQIRFCSACGLPSDRPSGVYCKYCGTHLDQEALDLTTFGKEKPIEKESV